MHDYVIGRAQRFTSASPWCMRSPASLRAHPFVTRWKVEPPSTQTGIYAWTLEALTHLVFVFFRAHFFGMAQVQKGQLWHHSLAI